MLQHGKQIPVRSQQKGHNNKVNGRRSSVFIVEFEQLNCCKLNIPPMQICFFFICLRYGKSPV